MNTVDARELLKKPYTRVVIPDEESGTFTASIVEFSGCFAQGDSPAEAYERLEAAAEAWIEAAAEMRQEIPAPVASAEFSGRFALRLPRGLHRQAAQLAELNGTSLNQFIVSTLAEKVGAMDLCRGLARQLHASIASTVVNAAKIQFSGAISRSHPATAGTLSFTPLLVSAGKEAN